MKQSSRGGPAPCGRHRRRLAQRLYFDAWDDRFHLDRWLDALRGRGLDPAFYVDRAAGKTKCSPGTTSIAAWKKPISGVKRSRRMPPGPHRNAGCSAAIAVRRCLAEACAMDKPEQMSPKEAPTGGTDAGREERPYVVRIRFARSGPAEYLGHLDMMRLFERSLRRAGIPLAYSQGYNPRPHLVFALPLGVGVAAEAEILDIETRGPFDPDLLVTQLSGVLPEGVSAGDAQAVRPTGKSIMGRVTEAVYRLSAPGIADAAAKLARMEEISVEKTIQGYDTDPGHPSAAAGGFRDRSGRLCTISRQSGECGQCQAGSSPAGDDEICGIGPRCGCRCGHRAGNSHSRGRRCLNQRFCSCGGTRYRSDPARGRASGRMDPSGPLRG